MGPSIRQCQNTGLGAPARSLLGPSRRRGSVRARTTAIRWTRYYTPASVGPSDSKATSL